MTAENLPREARALLDAIAEGESEGLAKIEGISPYVILYGGGSFEGLPDRAGYNGFPDWPGKDNSHAAGRYQFQPATWRGIVLRFKPGIPNFRDPGDQDWGAWFLAQSDYGMRTGHPLYQALKAGQTGDVGDVLQPTWTSMSDTTFPERYAMALATYPPDPVPIPTPPPPPPIPPVPTPVPLPLPPPGPTPPLSTSGALISLMILAQNVFALAGYYDGPIDGRPNDAFIDALQKYADWLDAQVKP